jgi:hypothetical protein
MKKRIAFVLGVAVFALVGVFAFGPFHSSEPEQNTDGSAEVTGQTGQTVEENTEGAADLSVREAVVEPVEMTEAIAAVSDVSIDEDEVSSQQATESEDVPDEKPGVNPETTPNVVTGEPVSQDKDHQPTDILNVTRQGIDYTIIPDRYNCGAWGNFTKVLASDTVNGIILQENEGINSFDFFTRNTDISGEIYFSGYDFSDYIVEIYNSDLIDREITLVFENCKFFIFRSLSAYPKVKLVFKNCTFNSFYGSCATFTYCKFGGYYRDGLVPYHDVTVKYCYFSNFASQDPAGSGYHSDGTQIYGKEGIPAENIRYEFCRFEVPWIPGANAINACIMLQLEFSSGINISFENCICNGGGYTIYATSKDKGFEYYRNVSISNISVGQSCKFGMVCPNVAPGVDVSNVFQIGALYVASVWKGNGKTHLSVTNDTLQDRLLVVYADDTRYEFIVPASRGGKESYFDRFEDYPIDIDICLDADCQYVVCFDCTSGTYEQIRFVTWDGRDSVSIPL